MKLSITVKPNSKKIGIETLDESHWIVRVKESPVDGKANEAVIKAIAEKLDIPKSRIDILKGHTSKHKLILVT